MTGLTDTLVLYPGGAPVSEHGGGVELPHRSFSITAALEVEDPVSAEGVIYSLGARFGGHSLFIRDARVRYVYNWLGELEQELVDDAPISAGSHRIDVRYEIDAFVDGSPHGYAELTVDGRLAARARIRTQPGYFSLAGEGATAGREVGQPVSSSYEPPFVFTGGRIDSVVVPLLEDEAVREPDAVVNEAFGRD